MLVYRDRKRSELDQEAVELISHRADDSDTSSGSETLHSVADSDLCEANGSRSSDEVHSRSGEGLPSTGACNPFVIQRDRDRLRIDQPPDLLASAGAVASKERESNETLVEPDIILHTPRQKRKAPKFLQDLASFIWYGSS